MTQVSFGKFIREKRQEKGLRLGDVAKALDCTVVYISDIELGRKPPPKAKMTAFSKVLDVSLDVLRDLAVRARQTLELDLEGKPERVQQVAVALARSWDNLSDEQASAILKTLEGRIKRPRLQ